MSRLAIATIAAISLLLAFAAPASAEAVEELATATVNAAEAPASALTTPASASSATETVEVNTPEPVETPEAAPTASGSDTSRGGPASGSGSAPVSPDPDPIAVVSDAVGKAATAPTALARPASQLAGQVVEDSTKAIASVPVVGEVSRSALPVVEDVSNAVGAVVEGSARWGDEALRQAPAQLLSQVVSPIPQAVDDLLASTGIEDGVLLTPSSSGPLSIGALPEGGTGEPGGLSAKYLGGFGGVKSSGIGVPGSLRDSPGAPSATLALSDPSRAAQHSNGPAPLDGPGPLPGSPGAAVPGSGASIFIPIAALLALLALVAPATLRRLREVPGFPAPTPFVCALERPG